MMMINIHNTLTTTDPNL